ncbi:MAG: DUF3263 domain-containing protein [Dermatophilus congolensis]|nr:DUF3263 domain-containing protein [Dermatophilus congolensis]
MHESRRRRTAQLSDRDRMVIDLERKWGSGPSAQEQKLIEAEEQLDLSPAGYSLILRALIDDPAAYAHDPQTIGTLRSMRDSRLSGGDQLPLSVFR